MSEYAKNTILYGPPGTGKTFNIRKRAVDICLGGEKKPSTDQEYNKKYEELVNQGRIQFITFHQSYGYEDFIEGIRPVMDGKAGELRYEIRDGVFKAFCKAHEEFCKAPVSVWVVNATNTTSASAFHYSEWFENSVIRMWTKAQKKKGIEKMNDMRKGDYAVVLDSDNDYRAIGFCRICEDVPITEQRENEKDYVHTVEWIWKASNKKDGVDLKKGNPNFTIDHGAYICDNKVDLHLPEAFFFPKVFIIDEINRGNISKIFGELITLIEDDKRKGAENEMKTILPYSGESFSVPENVYLLGTMNTADRSIALLDTALRRRFTFEEMMPKADLLKDDNNNDLIIKNINIKKLLTKMNERIEVLLDREHQIGHAYFMPLKKEQTFEKLKEIFKNKIIPLLQEYFYDDYEKIDRVLNQNGFVHKETNIRKRFAPDSNDDFDYPEAIYSIDTGAMNDADNYKNIIYKIISDGTTKQ